jgi:hypothetical protein
MCVLTSHKCLQTCHLRSVSSGLILCLHCVHMCDAECKGGNELFSCDELGKCGRKVLWRLSTSSRICMPSSVRGLRCRSHVKVALTINV